MSQSVLLPDDTIKHIKEAAKRYCRSINQQANYWIKLGKAYEDSNRQMANYAITEPSITNTDKQPVTKNLTIELKEGIEKMLMDLKPNNTK